MSHDSLTAEIERHKPMLLALASLNLNREALLTLGEFAEIPLTTEQQKYLRGPVIIAKSAWATDMHLRLAWMFDGVAHARLWRIFSEQPGQQALASELEVAIVMQPYTIDAPMTTEWTNVFMWAASQASLAYQTNSRHSGEARIQAFAEMGVKPLTRYEEQEYYNRLASDIRRSVVKHAPKIEKAVKRPNYKSAENESAFDATYLEQIFAQLDSRKRRD